MNITIVTGLSGSGKTMAAKMLEDMGFFCIDNMPPQLVVDMTRVLSESEAEEDGESTGRVALVMDTRNPGFVQHLSPALEKLQQMQVPVRILFLESNDAALISRYKQSRRDHPMAKHLSLPEAINAERQLLVPVKALATDVVDTSDLPAARMRERLIQLFSQAAEEAGMTVFIQSFGFKYGIPTDSDILLDVRFVPNPFYYEELRPLSGLDQPIIDFLSKFPEFSRYLEFYQELFAFSLPYYIREGRQRLNISVGCTGGRHRSVMAAEHLSGYLKSLGYGVNTLHRDLQRDVQTSLMEKLEEESSGR